MRISPAAVARQGKGSSEKGFGSFLGLLSSSIPFLALLLHNDHSTSMHTDFFIGEVLTIEGWNPSPERSTALKGEEKGCCDSTV